MIPTNEGSKASDAADAGVKTTEGPRPTRAFEEDSEDELGARLRQGDFERIAGDSRVREQLKSDRLRKIIDEIDSAKDGGKALERAKEDPEFRAFVEETLTLLDRD